MYKDASYKEKLEALAHWLPKIVDSTKKEIKNEHLKKDPQFIKKYLSSKHVNILNSEEIAAAYLLFISENSERAEPTAEFIISNWLTKNSELYNVFEDYLKSISEDFVSLQELSADQSDKLLELAYNYSDPEKVYIFSVCNMINW